MTERADEELTEDTRSDDGPTDDTGTRAEPPVSDVDPPITAVSGAAVPAGPSDAVLVESADSGPVATDAVPVAADAGAVAADGGPVGGMVGWGGRSALADRFWRIGFPVLMVLLVLAVPVLVWAGRTVVLQSTDGDTEARVSDPAAPGWQALADPTPTMLLLQTDPAGALIGATVLSLTGPDSGAILFLPVDTVPPGAYVTLAQLATSGPEAARLGAEVMIGSGIAEVVTLSGSSWGDLIAPVAPLPVQNPDDVFKVGTSPPVLAFAKGAVSITSSSAADYLGTRNAGESDLNRLVRHASFWQSWLTKVASTPGAEAVPGESESGLGRFVRSLARSRLQIQTVPVSKLDLPAGSPERFTVVVEQMQVLAAKVVPFPVGSASRDRVRVQLLDGVGTLHHGLDAASALVAGGAEIVLVGNARAFGVARTQLAYSDESRRGDVEVLARALGTGELVHKIDSGGGTDVVITLGQDFSGSATRPTGSVPPATAAPATVAPFPAPGVTRG